MIGQVNKVKIIPSYYNVIKVGPIIVFREINALNNKVIDYRTNYSKCKDKTGIKLAIKAAKKEWRN